MSVCRFTRRSAADQFSRLASQRHTLPDEAPISSAQWAEDPAGLDAAAVRSRTAIRNDPAGPTREEATRFRRERERQAAWALVGAVILLATIIAWSAVFSERTV